MRRTVVAIVAATIVIAAFSLAGCGGDSTTSDATAPAASAPANTTAVAVADMVPPDDSLSPTVTIAADQKSQPYQWPFGVDRTPPDIQDNLNGKQPMMIVYSDSTQSITKDQRAEIDSVMNKYRGLITLVTFDIVAAMPGSEDATSDAVAKTADLAQDLGVKFTPYFVFVDRYGRITWRFMGFVDRGLIEREVLRATQ